MADARRIWSFRQLLEQVRADEAGGGGGGGFTPESWSTQTSDVLTITAASDFADGDGVSVLLLFDPAPAPWIDTSALIIVPGLYRIGATVQLQTPASDPTGRFWIKRSGDPVRFIYTYGELAYTQLTADFVVPVSASDVEGQDARVSCSLHGDPDAAAVISAQAWAIPLALAPLSS